MSRNFFLAAPRSEKKEKIDSEKNHSPPLSLMSIQNILSGDFYKQSQFLENIGRKIGLKSNA